MDMTWVMFFVGVGVVVVLGLLVAYWPDSSPPDEGEQDDPLDLFERWDDR